MRPCTQPRNRKKLPLPRLPKRCLGTDLNVPRSFGIAFDSLGDYYVAAGDKPHAIEAFSKSLSLGNIKETRQKLDALRGK